MNVRSAHTPSFDVAVVGLGPVGSTLANLLGLCGVNTLVLEREAQAYHLPRAVHFDDEAMRVFQTIGLSDAVLPHVILSPGMRFVDTDGRLMLDWPRPAEITPMGWHLSYRFHQPDLENVLNDGLRRWPHVVVRNRCDVFAVDQDEHGVHVRYEDLSTGRLAETCVRYVVGCDGARSLVRRFMGSPMDDLGFHERWLVVDALLKCDRPDLGNHSIQFCNPKRPATYVRGTGNRRRWEITVLPDEQTQAVTQPEQIWQLLAPWISPDDAEIERAAVYTFHSTIAKHWRNGRLFIAGDSAHQTPPFLGQGMCAGIRDAANLAWKLHAVLRGGAEAGLLDSYENERSPHVREFIELAIRLGGLINTKAMEAGLATGQPRDNAAAKLDVQKPLLGPGLAAGHMALAGRPAPQFFLPDGRRSDDHVGYRYCLFADSNFLAGLSQGARTTLINADITVIRSGEAAGLDQWLLQQDVQAVMVRPDRYVLGAARSENDFAALLAAVQSPAVTPMTAESSLA
ncbi:bifunctional 3-(3-hydroxy-phenyl)propionate/3-hydroxycinnamic acid hydroxylase [Bradyrhizobium sp. WSM 1738]|uniref:bifunctional 3-(3-hydroxy-phenyl)propionate/3-hydroxycinnamic acid hydroxylase MhpA n=1 Tax=Bradyrhizobium hereditatis TaxID=2821405 RepID=UPI001CE31D71|nr:bifunctional 3-(3-hydroxy-phenyl)propionate/3-hydroxycinnamic acid hydroxylase [Bradyrhizobium hereditatis]MCA6113500.1 bifunctional 3-(3-hydroxy-phenyl)propionate/3-hydroxycinnamic acid hydroxylase [Bradyrhizobium hereditatis]